MGGLAAANASHRTTRRWHFTPARTFRHLDGVVCERAREAEHRPWTVAAAATRAMRDLPSVVPEHSSLIHPPEEE